MAQSEMTLAEARAALAVHMATREFAFANGHGCTIGTDPQYWITHAETIRLQQHVRDLEQT